MMLTLAVPLKNRQTKSIVKAWRKINECFKTIGMKPNVYVIDNECSGDLKL